MDVKFCLAFPREVVSVPVMRRVLGDTLRNLGIADESVCDLLTAVTEACTNVLRHGGTARRYDVVASVGPGGCLVEVVDPGQGFGTRAATVGMRAAGQPPVPAPRPRRAGRTRGGAPGQPVRARAPSRAPEPAPGRAPEPAPGRAPEPAQRHVLAVSPARLPSRHGGRVDDQTIARLPESGRGLQIMRALVDDVTMLSGPGRGTVVSMRKRVSWRSDAPLAGLACEGLRDAG